MPGNFIGEMRLNDETPRAGRLGFGASRRPDVTSVEVGSIGPPRRPRRGAIGFNMPTANGCDLPVTTMTVCPPSPKVEPSYLALPNLHSSHGPIGINDLGDWPNYKPLLRLGIRRVSCPAPSPPLDSNDSFNTNSENIVQPTDSPTSNQHIAPLNGHGVAQKHLQVLPDTKDIKQTKVSGCTSSSKPLTRRASLPATANHKQDLSLRIKNVRFQDVPPLASPEEPLPDTPLLKVSGERTQTTFTFIDEDISAET